MKLIHAALLLAAIALAQLFFGGGDGTRLVYVLPSFMLLGVSGVLASVTLWKAQSRMSRWCLLSVVCFAVFALVRISQSPSTWLALVELFAALSALLVYFITAFCIGGGRARTVAAGGLLILGVVQSAVGIYQVARDPGFHPLVEGGLPGASGRASGLFVNTNHLAGFLEVVFLLGVSFCLWGGFRAFTRMLVAYATLVCLAGLLLTGSRGGYFSTGVGFVVLVAMSIWTLRSRLSRELMPRVVATVAALALIIGVVAFATQRSTVIQSRANTVFSGLDVRPNLWEAAWKQFQLAPVFGTGSRTYTYYGRMFREMHHQRETDSPHSDWLQLLAEYGIVGVSLGACFVFAHLWHAWGRWLRIVRRRADGNPSAEENRSLALQIGAFSATITLLIHAAVDFNYHIPSNLMVAAFFMGALATRRARPEEHAPMWRLRLLHFVPVALGLWLLFLSVPKYRGAQISERVRNAARIGDIETVLNDGALAIAGGARNPELFYHYGEAKRFMSLFIADHAKEREVLAGAHEAFSTALELFPQEARYLLRDAWVLGKLGRAAEAETLLSKAKEFDPKSPAPWFFSALHWRRLSRHADAFAEFRAAENRSGGAIPQLQDEIGEYIDRVELEKKARESSPPPP